MLNYVDLCWFMLFYVDLCWFMLIYFDLASSYPSVLYALHLLLAPKACYDAWSECVIEVFSIPKLSFLNSGIDFSQLHNSGIELCQFLNGVFVWKGRRWGLALRQYLFWGGRGFGTGRCGFASVRNEIYAPAASSRPFSESLILNPSPQQFFFKKNIIPYPSPGRAIDTRMIPLCFT